MSSLKRYVVRFERGNREALQEAEGEMWFNDAEAARNFIEANYTVWETYGVSKETDLDIEAFMNGEDRPLRHSFEIEDIETKAIKAATKFLEGRGYEIIEELDYGPIDIVCEDVDLNTIAFVEVVTSKPGQLSPETIVDAEKMSRIEDEMLAYAAANEELISKTFRYDLLTIAAVTEDRAIIRHHINAQNGVL